MFLVVCLPCKLAIRVLVPATSAGMEEADSLVGRTSTFWPTDYRCPTCSKHARFLMEREAEPAALDALHMHDLTPIEAFAALNGLGLPEEKDCSFETVVALLKEHPIRAVIGRDVRGAERAVIDRFELWDGTVLYFGAGADGAVVYRVARPASYVARILGEAP